MKEKEKISAIFKDSTLSYALLLFTWIYLFYYYIPFLHIPLIEDEVIYGNPGIVEGLDGWLHYSFGHPPGWPTVNYLNYTLRGLGPFFSRSLILSISFLSSLTYFILCRNKTNSFVALASTLALLSYSFFTFAILRNQPVILATTLGIVALYMQEQKQVSLSFIALFFAIALRESALVFLVGSLIINRERKNLLAAGIQLFIFASYYIVFYYHREQILLNDQMRVLLENNAAIFSFNSESIFLFIKDFYLGQWPLYISFPLLLTLFFYFYSGPFRNSRLKLALFISSLCHFIFFALYADHGNRDTFMSIVPLLFLCSIHLNDHFGKNKKTQFITIAIIALSLLRIYQNIPSNDHAFKLAKAEAQIIQKMTLFIDQKLHSSLKILTTEPYNHFLENPDYGYTKNSSPALWHGGFEGIPIKAEPFLIFVPPKKTFAFIELKKEAQKRGYLKKSFSSSLFPSKVYELYYPQELSKL